MSYSLTGAPSVDGTSKDSTLLIYPVSCRTPRAAACEHTSLQGGQRRRRRELFSASLAPAGQAPPAESGAKRGGRWTMGSAWRKGSPGCASSGPAATARPRSRCFLRPRTPLCRAAGAAAGGLPPRSLPGRHGSRCYLRQPARSPPRWRETLAHPWQACQFSAALPRHPRVYSLSRSPPNSPAPGAKRAAGRVGLPGWLAASRAPEPIPGSVVRTGRPMGALNPPLAAHGLLPPAPRPPVPSHAMSTTRRRGGSTTDAPRLGRCSVRLFPSGDGAAHKRRLSIVLLPDPQILFSPPQKPPGVRNGKNRERGRRGNKLPATPAVRRLSRHHCLSLVARLQPTCPRQPPPAGPETRAWALLPHSPLSAWAPSTCGDTRWEHPGRSVPPSPSAGHLPSLPRPPFAMSGSFTCRFT